MPTATSSRRAEPWRSRLYLPAYRIADAARYAQTSPETVSYWHHQSAPLGPALPGKEPAKPLSYLQLVEVAFVAAFRNLGVSLQRIRRAREYAAQMFQAEFPFAQLEFRTEGTHLLLELQELEPDADLDQLIIADAHGQTGWKPMLNDLFSEFGYEDKLALTWHLRGRTKPMIIDPRISFGAPTVRGIPTWAIKGRYLAGEKIDEIKDDFNLTEDQVIQSLEFEGIQVDRDAA